MTDYCILAPSDDGPGTFRAQDRSGQAVVIDVLDACGREESERLKRETLAAAEMRLHVAPVLEVGDWAGRPFVVRPELPGQTLRRRAAAGPLAVRDLVDVGIQVAQVIDAANSVGIFHRHLSARHVVVSPRGEVTVTGFGYARALDGGPVCAAPEAPDHAKADSRTDIYGVGTVLWEMATGQVPPAGPPLDDPLRPAFPPLLARIIHTALDPDPEKRFQDLDGLVRALHLFQRGEATGQNLAKARLGSRDKSRKKVKVRRSEVRWKARLRLVQGLALLAFAVVVGGLLYLLVPRYEAFDKHEAAVVTSSGDVLYAALSPDATRLALVRAEPDGQSLWTQPTRGSARRILPPSPERFQSLAFARDGSALYFVRGPAGPGVLYSISPDGGEPRRLASEIQGGAISPDGERLAYLRGGERERVLVTARLDGSHDDVIMSRPAPAGPQAAAWAPDGRILVASIAAPNEGASLFKLDLEKRDEQQLGWHRWTGPVSLAWLPGRNGLMVAGPELGGASPLWRVAYPDGGAVPVTHDFGIYSGVSVSADGRSLATVRSEFRSSIWVAPENDATRARQITSGGRPDGVGGLDWTPDDRIVFASQEGANRGLWIVPAAGGEAASILSGPDRCSTPRISPDGSVVAFLHFRSGTPQIWAITPEGKSLRPVTRGGADYMPSFSPDGQTLYFASAQPSALGVWRMPFQGGRPEWLSRLRADFAIASPDGTRVAFRTQGPAGGEALVIPAGGGPSVTRFRMPEETQISWTRDGKALVWARTENGAGNLWAHPLDGGPPVKLTSFAGPGDIYAFAWSRDGRRLAVALGRRIDNVVLFRDTR